jgi:hypothetical protein
MHKVLITVLAAAAFSASAAMADNMSGTAQPVSQTMTSERVACHHDGEIIQAQSGPVICHLRRPQSGLHTMSREWFRERQLSNSTMNH